MKNTNYSGSLHIAWRIRKVQHDLVIIRNMVRNSLHLPRHFQPPQNPTNIQCKTRELCIVSIAILIAGFVEKTVIDDLLKECAVMIILKLLGVCVDGGPAPTLSCLSWSMGASLRTSGNKGIICCWILPVQQVTMMW